MNRSPTAVSAASNPILMSQRPEQCGSAAPSAGARRTAHHGVRYGRRGVSTRIDRRLQAATIAVPLIGELAIRPSMGGQAGKAIVDSRALALCRLSRREC